MRERDVIGKCFNYAANESVEVGIGDDAAVVKTASGGKLAISTDTLVAGVHFRDNDNPCFIARKAAAVSLSDIAAMGARPLWMTIAITFGGKNAEEWFAAIGEGFKSSAKQYDYAIIGGDLTRGAQTQLTTTVIGEVDKKAITRGGAKPGDDIWLSGTIGDAALALHKPAIADEKSRARLHNPSPRLDLSATLSQVASAAMDLSDGLSVAVCEMAKASAAKFVIDAANIPASATMQTLPQKERLDLMLDGGDGYEILFCAAAARRDSIGEYPGIARIGVVVEGKGGYVRIDGKEESLSGRGYEHNFGE
ncbi:MAG: thiamine-phosphate kinase [Gammaproteobacteria bacterium]